MLIPLAYLVASRLYRGRPSETAGRLGGPRGHGVLLLSCLGTAFQGFVLQQGKSLNLLLAAFFAEAALFYLLAAIWRDREFAVYACTAAAAAAVWQVLTFADAGDRNTTSGPSRCWACCCCWPIGSPPWKRRATVGLGPAAFQSANALLSLAAIAGALLSLSALAGNRSISDRPSSGLEAVLTATSVAALFLVRHPTGAAGIFWPPSPTAP